MVAAEDSKRAPAGTRRSSRLADTLLIVVSVVLSIAMAEGVVRYLNGQPLLVFPLPEPIDLGLPKPGILERLPVAEGVDAKWFTSDPPPLPNRTKPPPGWQEFFHYMEAHPSGNPEFRTMDNFKVYNSAFVGDPCAHRFLRYAPGKLFVYDPPDGKPFVYDAPDGKPRPPYRFYPDVTLPDHLVTNQLGWRGRPIEVPRRDRTIRIVFVGASTTIDAHWFPFSHPEFIGHWLHLWAAAHHPDIHFEVLNAGRESVSTTDLAAIVRTEVLPLRPDLVVYYEGGNTFDPGTIVPDVPQGSAVRPPPKQKLPPQWLQAVARYSALMGRIEAAVGYAGSDLDGHEWPKPEYQVVWPPGLDEFDPDLSYPWLPVNLNQIQRVLDEIRGDLATTGGELAVSSFPWMVKDGMVLDPIRHRYILEQLNVDKYPFRYRDIERLANFQNRLLAKYAATHGLPFVDTAGVMPLDPDLFVDAVHMTYPGVRVHGWVAMLQLLPTIEKHLKDGTWPAPAKPDLPLPTFTPREITFSCPKAP